jgi:hypothetical protein
MIDKLLAELLKAQDNLSEMSFTVGGEAFTFYFRYLTLLEKVRIEQMSIKVTTKINIDGTTEQKHEKQDHLIPIHTILEKALDKDGERVFSHTNPEHFKAVSKFPAGLASMLAYEMTIDIFGTMKEAKNG